MRRFASLLLSSALLAGCASLKHQPREAGEGDLHLSGRLSVQVAGVAGGKAGGGNGAFELSGQPTAGQLGLSTPLGSLVARAVWRDGDVRLQTPEDERRFDDLDALTREMLGEAIPVAALFDWLQGKPWAQAAHTAQGSGFEQLGWQIDLSHFGDGLIVATRKAEPAVTLKARIDKT